MATETATLQAPRLTTRATEDNPYVELVKAILHRAIQDAQGRCAHAGAKSPEQLEAEARIWLQDSQAVAELVELAGYDAEPVLRRIQKLFRNRRVSMMDV